MGPATVTEASAAACAATEKLAAVRHRLTRTQAKPPERRLGRQAARIGVFLCHCGINIGGVVDVPGVVVVDTEDAVLVVRRERAERVREVVEEVRRIHASGIQEVVLAGVHLGGYGSDIGSSLRALVDAVLSETRIPRVRLGSLEPWELEAGFTLACQTRPTSEKLVLDFDAA